MPVCLGKSRNLRMISSRQTDKTGEPLYQPVDLEQAAFCVWCSMEKGKFLRLGSAILQVLQPFFQITDSAERGLKTGI